MSSRPRLTLILGIALCASLAAGAAGASDNYSDQYLASDAIVRPQVVITALSASGTDPNVQVTYTGSFLFDHAAQGGSEHAVDQYEIHVALPDLANVGPRTWVRQLPQAIPLNPITLFLQGAGTSAQAASQVSDGTVSIDETWVDLEHVEDPARPQATRDVPMLHARIAFPTSANGFVKVAFSATVTGRTVGSRVVQKMVK